MKGQTSKLYVLGLILTIIGGTGLAGINVNSDLLFWIYTIMFSVGFGCCLTGYIR